MNMAKKLALSASVSLALAFTVSCSSDSDDDDGYKSKGNDIANYQTVEIGTQTWMAENLDYEVGNSKCYENKSANCEKYGRLYDWATAKTACPSGWHLPSGEDWFVLMSYVQTANGEIFDPNDPLAFFDIPGGKYLKTKSGWEDNGNGTDKYSFAALPGGNGTSDGSFFKIGAIGYWWSNSTEEDDGFPYRMNLSYLGDEAMWTYSSESTLSSVRCVKD
jgi:uncharacterized protein (TIGR02145 family)